MKILINAALLATAMTLVSASGCSNKPPQQTTESQTIPSTPAKPAPAGTLQVTLTGKTGPKGDLERLYGISLRDPSNSDAARKRLDQSPLKDRWVDLPKSFIRHPAGSHSYKMKSMDDPNVNLVINTLLPQLPPSVKHDFTWPPQFPRDQVSRWVTERTGRITIGNEPPNHVPELFPNGQAYVDFAEEVYRANPKLADKFWIQSGKPEVVRHMGKGSPMVRKHGDCLDAASKSVKAGRLPARVVTTHKLMPVYPVDRLGFYREMLGDYRSYFGNDVLVCFQEFNYRDEETESLDQILHVAEFLLIMARLRNEEGKIVDGAAFHQGFAVGTSNLFGLDAKGGQGSWRVGGLAIVWEEFGNMMTDGSYAFSKASSRPDDVQIEVFKKGANFYALYSNKSDRAIPTALNGTNITYVDQSLTKKTGKFSGSIPARSTGSIELTGI